MTKRSPLTRRQALAQIGFALGVAIMFAALVCAAALAPAPHVILPFIVVIGIAVPMTAATELPRAIATLRHDRAIRSLRRSLARLPETSHPLEG